MKVQCKECGAKVVSDGARGRTKRYCSDRCRKRASRRRLQPFPSGMMKRDTWARADDKRPIQVNGRAASSTDPRTWAQFDDVKDGPGDGYGIFMGQGLGVIDIDHCLTDSGLIKPWGRDVLRGIKEPVVFVEVSKSGRGLHVFIIAAEAPGRCERMGDGAVERYTRDRFVVTTGDRRDIKEFI